MKRNKSRFDKFAKKFFVFTMALSILGNLTIKMIDAQKNIENQVLADEIADINATIDDLTMQKQALVSFERLASVSSENGYTYRSDAVIMNNQTEVE